MAFSVATAKLGVAVPRCKKCGAILRWHRSVEDWMEHFLCDYCGIVFCIEARRLFECQSPVPHLYEPPQWVWDKYAPKLRAHNHSRLKVEP